MKTFLTALWVAGQELAGGLWDDAEGAERTRCGYLSSSRTEMSSSLMLRYWSTLLRTPRIWMSFLSSTVTSLSMRVLKKLQVVVR